MKDTKLIEILRTFSKAEVKSFDKFIRSPYAGSGRNVSGLFNLLKKNLPHFDDSNLTNEIVFKELFPREKFNSKKITNINTELTRLAEKFLIYEHINSDEFESERFLVEQYRDRRNEKLFSRSLKSLEKKLSKLNFDTVSLFSRQEKLTRLKIEYLLRRNEFDEAVIERRKYSEYFALSFFINSIRMMRDKEQINNTYSTTFESLLFNTIIDNLNFDNIFAVLRKNKYPDLWLIEMYYNCYLCAKDLDDERSFYSFQKLFYENFDKFSHVEKYFIFCDFASFCIRNENRGKNVYGKEELEVYKRMIEYNVFSASEKDYMSLMTYRNILFLALSLREYSWMNEFIEKCTAKLRPENVDNMKVFSRAHLEFDQGNFEAALENLGLIKIDFFAYKFDVKNLFMKIYYELRLYDQAFYMLDTYKQYLKNNTKLPEAYKLQFKNFIKYYQKLLKLRTSNLKVNTEDFINEISSIDALSARDWLIEKIKELKTKKSRIN